MEPVIRDGDRVIMLKCRGNICRRGDIIGYYMHNKYIIHRLVGKIILPGRTYMVEKGDGGAFYNIIPEEIITGKTLAVVRGNNIMEVQKKKRNFSPITYGIILFFYARFVFGYIVRYFNPLARIPRACPSGEPVDE